VAKGGLTNQSIQGRLRLMNKVSIKKGDKKMKKVINGDVIYNSKDDYSNVEEIEGSLDCRGSDAKVSFPELKTIGGFLYCEDTKASFPELKTIGWDLYCEGAEASFPQLTIIGSGLYCYGENTSTSFPGLKTIGWSLNCREAKSVSCPELEAIGSSLYCEGAEASFPQLTTIGGDLESGTGASFPQLIQDVGSVEAKKRVSQSFRERGFLFEDGILARLLNAKGLKNGSKLYTIKIIGRTKESYCIESDGVYSHGDTIKEAKESLIYKIGDRDKSEYADWKLDTKVTKREAIESYRVITGACEAGARGFMVASGEKKRKYTIKEIIEVTKGQYGNKEYSSFFE